MRTQIFQSGFNLWLSANDTYQWANRPNCRWPCSFLSNKRCFISFDPNGLCDFTINGGRGEQDCDGNELSAIVSDFMKGKLPKDHVSYDVAVGQFQLGFKLK